MMLLFPGKNTKTIDEFHPSKKLFHTLQESEEWGKMLNIDTVGALDDAIAAGKNAAGHYGAGSPDGKKRSVSLQRPLHRQGIKNS